MPSSPGLMWRPWGSEPQGPAVPSLFWRHGREECGVSPSRWATPGPSVVLVEPPGLPVGGCLPLRVQLPSPASLG